MTPVTSIETVQRLLGYRFHQLRLLEEALTHKSYSNERRSKDRTENERLEFLGDAAGSLSHPAMGEMLRLIREHDIKPANVEKVDVGGNHSMLNALLHHQPKTGLEGKFSMEF